MRIECFISKVIKILLLGFLSITSVYAGTPTQVFATVSYGHFYQKKINMDSDISDAGSESSYTFDLDNSNIYGGGVGYQFIPGLSLKLALEYNDLGVDNEHVSTRIRPKKESIKSYSFNVISSALALIGTADGRLIPNDLLVYWFTHDTFITPFIEVGYGYSWNTTTDARSKNVDNVEVLAPNNDFNTNIYIASVGLRYQASQRFAFNVGWRYIYAGELDSSSDLLGRANLGDASGLNASLQAQEIFASMDVFI